MNITWNELNRSTYVDGHLAGFLTATGIGNLVVVALKPSYRGPISKLFDTDAEARAWVEKKLRKHHKSVPEPLPGGAEWSGGALFVPADPGDPYKGEAYPTGTGIWRAFAWEAGRPEGYVGPIAWALETEAEAKAAVEELWRERCRQEKEKGQ